MIQSFLQSQPKSFWRKRNGQVSHVISFQLLKIKLKAESPINKQQVKADAVGVAEETQDLLMFMGSRLYLTIKNNPCI